LAGAVLAGNRLGDSLYRRRVVGRAPCWAIRTIGEQSRWKFDGRPRRLRDEHRPYRRNSAEAPFSVQLVALEFDPLGIEVARLLDENIEGLRRNISRRLDSPPIFSANNQFATRSLSE
jgi:hypothetical protein